MKFIQDEYSPLRSIYANKAPEDVVIPSQDKIYKALELTPQEKVKVVIFGQDPYPRREDAMGLAFSVPKGRRITSSLRGIHRALQTSGYNHHLSGDLSPWTKKGVLLLNTTLTTIEGRPNAHKGMWDKFIANIIRSLQTKPIVYWLMGKEAQRLKMYIKYGVIYETVHPSGAAGHGFGKHAHFKNINNILDELGICGIDWNLEK